MKTVSIEEEFKKNPQLKQEDINHLRQWINQEKCVPTLISDLQLVLFLHCCHYNIQATKDLLKLNYKWRAENSDYFLNRNPRLTPRLQYRLNAASMVVLPKRTSANEIIILYRILNNDPKNFYFSDAVKVFLMFVDLYLVHHGTCNGVVFLYDSELITFGTIRKIDISSLSILFFFLQEAIHINVTAIHYMNSHPIFDIAFSMFKPFIKGNLMNKIYFHKKQSTTILSHLPAACVPKIYGGEETASLEYLHEQSHELVRSSDSWFEAEENALKNFKLEQSQKKA